MTNQSYFLRAEKALDVSGKPRKAFKLLLRGVKNGDTSCMLNLGYMYDEGIGVKKNVAKALHLYKRDYLAGGHGSAGNIAILYRKIGADMLAKKYVHLAAKQGNEDAQLELKGEHIMGSALINSELKKLIASENNFIMKIIFQVNTENCRQHKFIVDSNLRFTIQVHIDLAYRMISFYKKNGFKAAAKVQQLRLKKMEKLYRIGK